MRGAKPRHRLAAAGGAALIAASALAGCGSGGGGLTINVYKYPQENFQKIVDKCNERNAGYEIVYHKLPREADGQREQLVRRLAAGDTGMDVLGLDVTWTAELAEAGWIKEFTGEAKARVEDGTLETPLETARYEGKLYGAPDNTNVQLLWYRGDLVPTPPRTWDEMIDMGAQLEAQGKPGLVEATGKQYEGLVVLFNTLVRSAGGEIIDDSGTKAVVDDKAVKALEVLKKFATSEVVDPSFSNAAEDDARLAMERGDAAFMLNWPYVYAAAQANPEFAKNLKWAPFPSIDGGDAKVTVGGVNYGVSAFTEHPEESFDAVLCLRSAENQKFAAINDGVPPTIESVYEDPEMAEPYPMKEAILETLKSATVRPRTPAYQNVSTVISTILSPPASIDPQATADRLRGELQDALDSKGVLP
ncbi:ABC transporter substrate-binding protein [Saccharothrix coeruleofusca]|uniref:Sugar ABC transporter substrate-binding protein n=1 Tax=Saccharothrix coeruleofusca TaxID=33919 RepID=A0A918AME0_9PSEU|nr:ABC transporter substrate-binding protein [Saccharothrix coeruleofusca]MBP2340934.1 multiple sugar transport system substrate-binding protein [Saccharothrix coeruleofusca]GGP60916.1 sugar ABC transporter substrate-binding protein [Saccharothrix coeruleofusca]